MRIVCLPGSPRTFRAVPGRFRRRSRTVGRRKRAAGGVPQPIGGPPEGSGGTPTGSARSGKASAEPGEASGRHRELSGSRRKAQAGRRQLPAEPERLRRVPERLRGIAERFPGERGSTRTHPGWFRGTVERCGRLAGSFRRDADRFGQNADSLPPPPVSSPPGPGMERSFGRPDASKRGIALPHQALFPLSLSHDIFDGSREFVYTRGHG